MGKLKELWNKTIFSDMVEEYREKKRFKREIQQEVKKRMREEGKELLIQKYMEEEKQKILGTQKKKPNMFSKIASELEQTGKNITGGGNSNIGELIGGGRGMDVSKILGTRQPAPKEKVKYVYVYKHKKKKKKNKPQRRVLQDNNPKNEWEEKIKRMI